MQTMTPGGAWIQPPHDAPVTYVVHEAHIKRLLSEGGRVVADPRTASAPVAPRSDADLQAEIARLQAELTSRQHRGQEAPESAESIEKPKQRTVK